MSLYYRNKVSYCYLFDDRATSHSAEWWTFLTGVRITLLSTNTAGRRYEEEDSK